MRHEWSLGVATGVTCLCCMTALGYAQEKLAPPVPARPQPAINRAAEALRREAEAGIKVQEQEFARLEAHPPLPLLDQAVMLQIRDVNRVAVPFPDHVVLHRGRLPIWFARIRADHGALDEEVPPEPQLVVARETFDLNVFGSTGDGKSARAHLEMLLRTKIDVTEQMNRLTPVQKKKLLLAGRGDIKRLLDRIEAERKAFENLTTDPDRCEEFLVQLQPLTAMIFRGPFGNDSLFAKTLKKIRDDENLVRREQGHEARAPGR